VPVEGKSASLNLWWLIALVGGIWAAGRVFDLSSTQTGWGVWIGAEVVGFAAFKILNSDLIRALGTVIVTLAFWLGLSASSCGRGPLASHHS
jgi:FtsH-binding integral membrane protein